MPIVNNYGVWTDEFEALGMSHTLECSWPDAVCYFGEGKEVGHTSCMMKPGVLPNPDLLAADMGPEHGHCNIGGSLAAVPLALFLCNIPVQRLSCAYMFPPAQVKVGRGYGRVSRRKLREALLQMCSAQGVTFLDAEVSDMQVRHPCSALSWARGRQCKFELQAVSRLRMLWVCALNLVM